MYIFKYLESYVFPSHCSYDLLKEAAHLFLLWEEMGLEEKDEEGRKDGSQGR